jgi:sortase A
MQLHLGAAGRAGSRLAGADLRRHPALVLLGVGLSSITAGLAILLTVLAPYFINPVAGTNLNQPPTAASTVPDTATVLDPTQAVSAAVPAPPYATTAVQAPTPLDGVRFDLRIPSLGYNAVVRQGVALNVLALGPGHYPGTPWPGQPGNVAVAGHNTFWLSFSHLRPGARVEIQTQHALYLYEIIGSSVVNPNDGSVLASTGDDRLTLTTCYPLWAGALATQRLIFTARPIGGVA